MDLHLQEYTDDAIYQVVDAIDDFLDANVHPPLEYYDMLGMSFALLLKILVSLRICC